jgi:hypothetical protein
MAENKSSLSGSQSYEELSEYWDSHSLVDHWDSTSAVEFELDVTERVSVEARKAD